MSKDTNMSLVFMFFLLIPSLFSDVVHFHRCMNFNELLLIPTDARCFSNTSFKYVPSIGVRYCSSFSTNVQQCPLILMDVHHFKICCKRIPKPFQMHSQTIPNVFQSHPKCISKACQGHFKCISKQFQVHSKAILKSYCSVNSNSSNLTLIIQSHSSYNQTR